MNKSVLIISYYFAPHNEIGSIRPTKLAKFLTRMGYRVTVICGKSPANREDTILARDLKELRDVHVVEEPNVIRKREERKPSTEPVPEKGATATGAGWKRRWMDHLYIGYQYVADKAFERLAIDELKRMNRLFDVVISSYGPHSCHRIAYQAKKLGIAKRWIADFRDNVTMPFPFMNGRIAPYIERVRQSVDAMTVASDGFLRMMGLEDAGRVITNGFDAEDLLDVAAMRNEKLTLMYSGQLFGFHRDLSPIFRALRSLVDEGELAMNDLELLYAGRDEVSFLAQAQACGLGEAAVSVGYVGRAEALRLERSADALLLSVRNTNEVYGNLPGKLLEYMMLDKPVLGCACGDKPDCDAARIVRDTGLGLFTEEAAGDGEAFREALRAYCRAYKAGEPLPFAPDRKAIQGFSHKAMTERFVELIEAKRTVKQ